MMKTATYDFKSFCKGEKKRTDKAIPTKLIHLGGSLYAVAIPKHAYAAGGTAKVFGDIYPIVMDIVDWIVVGVFILCGLQFMRGDRSKALEVLLGGCIGYLIARHAIDIREFLKGIGQ